MNRSSARLARACELLVARRRARRSWPPPKAMQLLYTLPSAFLLVWPPPTRGGRKGGRSAVAEGRGGVQERVIQCGSRERDRQKGGPLARAALGAACPKARIGAGRAPPKLLVRSRGRGGAGRTAAGGRVQTAGSSLFRTWGGARAGCACASRRWRRPKECSNWSGEAARRSGVAQGTTGPKVEAGGVRDYSRRGGPPLAQGAGHNGPHAQKWWARGGVQAHVYAGRVPRAQLPKHRRRPIGSGAAARARGARRCGNKEGPAAACGAATCGVQSS
ncbi:MAG: hypothetical protein J3K34DRAFT_447560 [Monoraphidium minutum]|nr:MAG: hypothetical protein J3K34DRAFT_447560 [Monoraphidium minutum]